MATLAFNLMQIRVGRRVASESMHPLGILFLLPLALAVTASAADAPRIDFNRDIRPILSDKCFHCHGPDSQQRQADLRLDNREAVHESGTIEPGDAATSALYERITSEDEGIRMPPPDSNRSLTKREIKLIRDWINSGADYPPYWSFIPVEKPDVPTIANTSGTLESNPIDAFVRQTLAVRNAAPLAEASREALLRRVTFDLVGLPPTIEELDAFLADASPDAYERVVDRLLASPHYGERMAQDWLDLARYSDSFGYSADRERTHWRWRDWVIKAFNDNMSYKDFVTWQLAGDLLPNATKEQILATGFCRNHPQTEEGGVVEEEYRVEYVADRVQTFGTAFLGLTLGCARCHDHKFDPVSQREFYELFSFFNNVDEAGQITWLLGELPTPTVMLPTDDQQRCIDNLQRTTNAAQAAVNRYRNELQDEFAAWRTSQARDQALENALPTDMSSHFTLDEVSKESIPNSVTDGPIGMIYDTENQVVAPESLPTVKGINGNAVRLDGDAALWFNGVGKFSRAQPFTIGLWVWIPKDLLSGAIFHNMDSGVLYRYRGYQVCVEQGKFDVRIARNYPYNAIQMVSKEDVPREQWVHVALTYDGSSTAAGVRLYVDGELEHCDVLRDNLYKEIYFPRNATPHTESRLQVGARRRDKGLSNGLVDEITVFERQLTAIELAALAKRDDVINRFRGDSIEIDTADDATLFEFFLSRQPKYQELIENLAQARAQLSLAVEPIAESMVMAEMPVPRQTHVLERGLYSAPREAVSPGTPQAVLSYPRNLPKNRLGLAEWLFLPENPLTARVAVNRIWQLLFGRGLVATPDNFGSQGEVPSHPELLDYLAWQFRDSGCSVKTLVKMIAMSATYRQDSQGTAEMLATDPLNIWLSRGPNVRLTAEQIRDQALLASGLLVRKIGGPSVKPYQPAGLWNINPESPDYVQEHGDNLYRRSLYTVWKQTNPPPTMSLFDAPTRSYCVVRREQTATPLQALVMFNDPQFVEAARVMAQHSVRQFPDQLTMRWQQIFRAATSRYPSQQQIEVLDKLYQQQLGQFSQEPERADRFLTTGEYPVDNELWSPDVAATTMVASAVLSLEQCNRKP